MNPSGACTACDPKTDQVGWTPVSNACLIDSKCYAKGTKNPAGCGNSNTYCNNTDLTDDSVLTLKVALPAAWTKATLSFQQWFEVGLKFDWSEIRIDGKVAAQTCLGPAQSIAAWTKRTLDLSTYAGKTITIKFHLHRRLDGPDLGHHQQPDGRARLFVQGCLGLGPGPVVHSDSAAGWLPDEAGGVIVRWAAADSAAPLVHAALNVTKGTCKKTRMRLEVGPARSLAIMDAALRGADLAGKEGDELMRNGARFGLRVQIPEGRYAVDQIESRKGTLLDGSEPTECSTELTWLRPVGGDGRK